MTACATRSSIPKEAGLRTIEPMTENDTRHLDRIEVDVLEATVPIPEDVTDDAHWP